MVLVIFILIHYVTKVYVQTLNAQNMRDLCQWAVVVQNGNPSTHVDEAGRVLIGGQPVLCNIFQKA